MITPSPFDRIFAAFRAFVTLELDRLKWLGTYEYSVVAAGTQTVDVNPIDPSTGLPALTQVPLRSGLLGQTVTASPGSLAMIRFVNGDPARPICVGLSGTPSSASIDASGTFAVGPSAQTVTLADGTLGVALEGCGVSIFFPPGCAVTGTITLSGGATVPVTAISIANGLGATLSVGSPNVLAE